MKQMWAEVVCHYRGQNQYMVHNLSFSSTSKNSAQTESESWNEVNVEQSYGCLPSRLVVENI